MSEAIRAELARIADRLGHPGIAFVLERPRDAGHGDLATNLAMVLARLEKAKPRQTAEQVIAELALPASVVARTEIAGPGFINFWLAEDQLALVVRQILERGVAYGRSEFGVGLKVNVEFVSANPTGPLHVGHGRGAAYGDALASLLQWTGHAVTREFYINDAGTQIDKLALSLWARVQHALGREADIPDGGYHGQYLAEAAEEVLRERGPDFADLPAEEGVRQCRALALRMQRAEQDRDLADFGVHFEVFTSEQSLYDRGLVDEALVLLAEKGLTYEEGGALWLRTTQFGDDKDRVLRKSDASLTYLVPDIAYHVDKRSRGFDRAIDVWGADHHGYVPRMRSVLAALGMPPDFFDVALLQLVKVVRGGEEVKMSKRSGEFVTLRDLVEEVGVDAARFFFLMRPGDSQLIFDIELAKRQTDENPVFYVQMAHARLSGIFRTAGHAPEAVAGALDLAALPAPEDQELLKKLGLFPEVVDRGAREREPHRVTNYLQQLATAVHGWYHHTRAVGAPEGAATEQARLLLARAARTVLANGLALLGITAPERM
ncbi:MAG TPA: arginine--tRNA ligase [Gemmatimonadales bacterium]|nr:arginine--tRNA ligase [Gemmatimonadales bacterium]